MKIDQLPVETLMTILGFVTDYEEVSLVNKLFYDIVCKLNDANICLRIDSGTDSKHISAMLVSHRNVSRVEIAVLNHENVRQVASVVEKFSATIKFLSFKEACDESFLLDILLLTPNIESLHLKILYDSVKPEQETFLKRFVESVTSKQLSIPERWFASFRRNEAIQQRQDRNHDLNLMKLSSLTIIRWKDMYKELVRIPVGVLTELRIGYFQWNKLSALIDRQPNIKKLKVEFERDDNFGMEVFEKLTLESLEIDGYSLNSVPVIAILSKQTKLKSLVLLGRKVVDGDVMSAVANNLELEKLEMIVSETPALSFVKIQKLKQLKDLKLEWYGRDHNDSTVKLKIISGSDNFQLKKLSMHWDNEIPPDCIERLVRSAPNLEQFKLFGNHPRSQFDVDTILQHFNFVKILTIPLWHEPLIVHGDYSNRQLRELSIRFATADLFYKHWLPELISDYPNLNRLKLIFCDRDLLCRFEPILRGFTKLESLIVKSNGLTVTEDLIYLHDCKHNLKFVKLFCMIKSRLPADLVEKLHTKFSVIKEDGLYLMMAFDRYTAKHCARKSDWPVVSQSSIFPQ